VRRRAATPNAVLQVCGAGTAERGALELDLGDAVARLDVSRDGSLRLRAAAGRRLPPDRSEVLGREPWRASNAEAFAPRDGGFALAFDGPDGALRVEVDERPFGVRIFERGGHQIARLADLRFGPGAASRIELVASPEQRFFGFGSKTGPLDKRGSVLRMRCRDAPVRERADPLYVSIPFFLRLSRAGDDSRADGFLLDVTAPSRFDVAAADASRVAIETDDGGIDLTLFPGPLPADVLRRYTARTGRASRPPRWALGHHQSRWGYGSAARVRRVARELRRRRIPTDVIHLDIDHMDGYRVFTFDRRRFRDPAGLCGDLAGQGFRAVAIVDPGVKADPRWAVFREGVARDVFLRRADGTPYTLKVWPRDAALPDFARADVRAWWGEQHRALLAAGVAGIWNDMNEPAGWARELRLGRLIVPLARQDLSSVVQADPADPERSVPHESLRNAYGHLECRATREALETLAPRQRPFVLSRSGFAGVQRYAALWTGDTFSRWEQLRLSVRMLLGLSVSGVPFCGADIGGFAGHCSRELFARWMQVGALYPFSRTHSMWLKRPQEPWRFGARVESIARAALELRMRLLPYLYGLFCEAEASGSPVWRPLFYEYPDDARAADVDDQWLLGRDLLVAPVMAQGERHREVYLPAGTWFALDDGARWIGPRSVRVAAPLERIPIFARGGAVIPTQSPVQHTAEVPAEPLVLEVFPGGDGAGDLVEDDGATTAYRNGAELRTPYRLRGRAGGRLRLELGAREGPLSMAPRPLRVALNGCPPPTAVWLDALRLAPAAPSEADAPGAWSWRAGVLSVRWIDDGTAHTLEVEPAP